MSTTAEHPDIARAERHGTAAADSTIRARCEALTDRDYYARQHAAYKADLLNDEPWTIQQIEASARVADLIDQMRRGESYAGVPITAEFIVGYLEHNAAACRAAVKSAKSAPIDLTPRAGRAEQKKVAAGARTPAAGSEPETEART